MFARQALIGLTLISSIFALQDCCYLEPDQMQYQGGLKYRNNALDGVFYDNVPADGTGSVCGLQMTRDPNDEDNCSAVTMSAYYGYCDGVAPEPVTCTDDYVVKTSGDPVQDQTAKSRRRENSKRLS